MIVELFNSPCSHASTISYFDVSVFDIRKKTCELVSKANKMGFTTFAKVTGAGALVDQFFNALKLRVDMDFELFVGFDKQTTEVEGQRAGEELAASLAGDEGDSTRRRDLTASDGHIWRDLQETSEGPCVILAMTTLNIQIPLLAKIEFGTAVGGLCDTAAEETGVRCSPSGFFLNIDQDFKFSGGPLGILANFLLSEAGDVGIDTATSGNSIGIFRNPEGDTEAVVLRLEMPPISLFGIGAGRIGIHFQHVKGSEIQRRRTTLLRKRTRSSTDDDWGLWITVSEQNPLCTVSSLFDIDTLTPSCWDTEL